MSFQSKSYKWFCCSFTPNPSYIEDVPYYSTPLVEVVVEIVVVEP